MRSRIAGSLLLGLLDGRYELFSLGSVVVVVLGEPELSLDGIVEEYPLDSLLGHTVARYGEVPEEREEQRGVADRVVLLSVGRERDEDGPLVVGDARRRRFEDDRVAFAVLPCLRNELQDGRKLTFSSSVAAAEFSKFADILSAALSQHHLSGFEIAQLEFHHLH